MKKLFLLLALVALPFVADAQTAKYATFSYDSVMHVMPDYKAALAALADLRKQYDAEIKRTEDDFNAKYESFIEVYSGLDTNIRNKRQSELPGANGTRNGIQGRDPQTLAQCRKRPLEARPRTYRRSPDSHSPRAWLRLRTQPRQQHCAFHRPGAVRRHHRGTKRTVTLKPFSQQIMMFSDSPGPIGVFDSGYGGLTILHGFRQLMPEYDYMYLGDNARAPYGSRSFEVVYQFTRQYRPEALRHGMPSRYPRLQHRIGYALRSIQERVLPELAPDRRVLGIIRPTVEVIGDLTKSRHVGVLATEGTIKSGSYALEVAKFHPDIQVSGVACPLWAAIVEANEADSPGADYFVKKRIDQLMLKDPDIDTIILGCTHYPLLMNSIVRNIPDGVRIVPQASMSPTA